ncbi:MAG: SDR family NAD(P)-dependent oxidoreductase [Armatimonadia bacterium]|nr:SDR family NAD(P)-dependent oxidoreductase [Armatimonadia bacterium]
MASLEGQVCVVTGASRGIGAAVARRLARAGATVVLVARSQGALDEEVAGIRSEGGTARGVSGDLRQDAFVASLFESIGADYGRLDVLVNNAGVAPFGGVEDLDIRAFRDCLELNVVAAFACTQQAVRLMRRKGDAGKIINIGSVRSHWTEAGDGGAYNASKFALRALTESVARELQGAGSRIAVGMVCPGIVDTPLTNPDAEPRPEWLSAEVVADAVAHAAAAPANVNVFDVTLFPTSQTPW